MQRVLVIDDDRDMCLLLKRFLERHHYEVTDHTSGKKALSWLEENKPDIILCDLRLEDMNGLDILDTLNQKDVHIPFIVITGYSDVKSAVDIMKHGAYDYVTKPLFPDEILLTIKQALLSATENPRKPVVIQAREEHKKVTDNTVDNAFADSGNYSFSDEYITGKSMAFQQIMQQIKLVAPTNYSVIIYGESGSGKEAIAHEIHKRSKRANHPFVAIDCGALSKELAASEMFGHEKGSFTGALVQKTGNFELANGGTVFLDEIANLSYDVQISLLRVVQERKMRRVGGTKDIQLDVRIIVASNEKLWDAAGKGKFREDLYHRFNEFSINLPPLRERQEDIMIFAHHFLRITNKELEKNVQGFSKEAEAIFTSYVWYGNLRELKNVIKRSTLLTDSNLIEVKSLPFEISNFHKLSPFTEEAQLSGPAYHPLQTVATNHIAVDDHPANNGHAILKPADLNLKAASIDAEYEIIFSALKQVNFNKSKAAKMLNIDRKTLYNKIKEYQLVNNK
jgi:two-component system response regulator HydG